jgi:hypothetical protein
MKIISIRQPWASLIVEGYKDVENRTWRTFYRGPLLIHASLRADNISSAEIEDRFGVRLDRALPLGGVVGVAELVDCVRSSESRWHAPGCWGFVLRNSRLLPFVKWPGALSLRDAPAELLELLDLSTPKKEAAAEAAAQLARSPFVIAF